MPLLSFRGAISPYLLNPNNANLKGKAAWIPCGLNVLLLIYGYFRIPETQGRNSEELDILFGEFQAHRGICSRAKLISPPDRKQSISTQIQIVQDRCCARVRFEGSSKARSPSWR